MPVVIRKIPLPATVEEMEANRVVPNKITLNDHVCALHIVLFRDSETYRRFLDAVSKTEAVEGSLDFDDCKAAEMIRDLARSEGLHHNFIVAEKNLKTISKALRRVLSWYGISRKVRAITIAGEQHPDAGDD